MVLFGVFFCFVMFCFSQIHSGECLVFFYLETFPPGVSIYRVIFTLVISKQDLKEGEFLY